MRKPSCLVLALAWLLAWSPAALAEEPYDGYCVNGQPVVTRWDPGLDTRYEPYCYADNLVIRLKSIIDRNPPVLPREMPDPPADWSAWAQIWLNDQAVRNPYKDVVPYVTASTGRTMIPLRMVVEAMGGTATWDEATRTVTRVDDVYTPGFVCPADIGSEGFDQDAQRDHCSVEPGRHVRSGLLHRLAVMVARTSWVNRHFAPPLCFCAR